MRGITNRNDMHNRDMKFIMSYMGMGRAYEYHSELENIDCSTYVWIEGINAGHEWPPVEEWLLTMKVPARHAR